MLKKRRGLTSAVVASLALWGAGCVTVAPPGSAPLLVATTKRVSTLTGVVSAPPSLISNNGGGLISDNGGGIIGNNGSGLIGKTKLRVLAAETWVPVESATITLTDESGKPVKGVPSVSTDAAGRFTLAGVPLGGAWVVKATSGRLVLSSLARAEVGGKAAVTIDPATTVVTARLQKSLLDTPGALARVAIAEFQQLTSTVREELTRREEPLDLSTPEKTDALFDDVADDQPTLKEQNQQLIERAQEPPAEAPSGPPPASPPASPHVSPAPTDPTDPNTPIGPAPRIDEVVPAAGSPGMVVRLRGQHFGTNSGDLAIRFGNRPAAILSTTPEAVTVRVPAGATDGPLMLWMNGHEATSALPFDVVESGALLAHHPAGEEPRRLAIAPDGAVWISSKRDAEVLKLDPVTGAPLGTFTAGFSPFGLAFDPTGHPWVANRGSNTVQKLALSGGAATTFPVGIAPESLAFDADGHLWVSNYNDAAIRRLNATTGEVLWTYEEGFSSAGRIGIDAQGNVYIVQWGEKRVTRISPTREVTHYTVGLNPAGLAIAPDGDVWVTNSGLNPAVPSTGEAGAIQRIRANGTVEAAIAVSARPVAIALAAGRLWIGHAENGRLTRYDPATGEKATFILPEAAEIYDLAVDAAEQLWVTHSGNKVAKVAP